jgi:hypothetical protein
MALKTEFALSYQVVRPKSVAHEVYWSLVRFEKPCCPFHGAMRYFAKHKAEQDYLPRSLTSARGKLTLLLKPRLVVTKPRYDRRINNAVVPVHAQ